MVRPASAVGAGVDRGRAGAHGEEPRRTRGARHRAIRRRPLLRKPLRFRGDRCKIFWWERGGFVVYYKRLERGRMRLPAIARGASRVILDGAQLAMLLDGIDLARVTRPAAWSPRGIDTRSRS